MSAQPAPTMPYYGMPMMMMTPQGVPMQMPMQQMPMQQMPMTQMPVMPGSAVPSVHSVVMAPAPPAPGTPGYVYKDFAHLGPVQAKPTSWNQQDDMLLHKLYAMYGTEPGKDGLPGFPYIGAPLIGAYEGDAPAAEEDPIDDDEVRGTQV